MTRFSEPIRERARGRWRGMLPSLGVDASYLTGKHRPCPICQAGRDRFRFSDKDGRGTWICNQCGHGDGFDLVQAVTGCDFREAARRVEEIVGGVPADPVRRQRSDAEKLDACRQLWSQGCRVSPGDPVDRFLSRRGLAARPRSLRAVADCQYPGEAGEPPRWFPAMVARVTNAEGEAVSVHRTFLTSEGAKAPVEKARQLMPGSLPRGSAVRLGDPVDGRLGVGEGIETSLAAAALFGVPCWATLFAVNLERWVPPAGIRELTIFADNDANFTGQRAAFALANRLAVNSDLTVRIETPSTIGADWNDVLMQEHAHA